MNLLSRARSLAKGAWRLASDYPIPVAAVFGGVGVWLFTERIAQNAGLALLFVGLGWFAYHSEGVGDTEGRT